MLKLVFSNKFYWCIDFNNRMHFFYDEKKIIWVDIIALQTMVLLCTDFTIMFEQNAGYISLYPGYFVDEKFS